MVVCFLRSEMACMLHSLACFMLNFLDVGIVLIGTLFG